MHLLIAKISVFRSFAEKSGNVRHISVNKCNSSMLKLCSCNMHYHQITCDSALANSPKTTGATMHCIVMNILFNEALNSKPATHLQLHPLMPLAFLELHKVARQDEWLLILVPR